MVRLRENSNPPHLDDAVEREQDSGVQAAGRRDGRSVQFRIGGRMKEWQQAKITGRSEHETGQCARELQLFHLEIKRVGFLFRLLARGNLFAERAGMVAVEGLADGLGHTVGAEIFREHRRPRDGLKYRPMAADGRDKRGDHE